MSLSQFNFTIYHCNMAVTLLTACLEQNTSYGISGCKITTEFRQSLVPMFVRKNISEAFSIFNQYIDSPWTGLLGGGAGEGGEKMRPRLSEKPCIIVSPKPLWGRVIHT